MLFHVVSGLLICQAFCSALPNQPVNPHQSRNIQEKISSIFNGIVPEKEKLQDVVQEDNKDNSISHGAEELPQGNRVNFNLQDYQHQEKKNRIKRGIKSSGKPVSVPKLPGAKIRFTSSDMLPLVEKPPSFRVPSNPILPVSNYGNLLAEIPDSSWLPSNPILPVSPNRNQEKKNRIKRGTKSSGKPVSGSKLSGAKIGFLGDIPPPVKPPFSSRLPSNAILSESHVRKQPIKNQNSFWFQSNPIPSVSNYENLFTKRPDYSWLGSNPILPVSNNGNPVTKRPDFSWLASNPILPVSNYGNLDSSWLQSKLTLPSLSSNDDVSYTRNSARNPKDVKFNRYPEYTSIPPTGLRESSNEAPTTTVATNLTASFVLFLAVSLIIIILLARPRYSDSQIQTGMKSQPKAEAESRKKLIIPTNSVALESQPKA